MALSLWTCIWLRKCIESIWMSIEPFYFKRICILMCRWIDIVSIRQFLSFRFDNLWTIREHQERRQSNLQRLNSMELKLYILFFAIRQQFSIQHACGFCQWFKLIYELQKKRSAKIIFYLKRHLTWISSFFFLSVPFSMWLTSGWHHVEGPEVVHYPRLIWGFWYKSTLKIGLAAIYAKARMQQNRLATSIMKSFFRWMKTGYYYFTV